LKGGHGSTQGGMNFISPERFPALKISGQGSLQ
jgi:hypothetical protein